MDFRLNVILIFSALLFLSSKTTAQQGIAPSPFQDDDNVYEEIKNVEKNEEVQDLGKSAVIEINKQVTEVDSMTFSGVVTALRRHELDGYRYLLVIKSKKKVEKIEGHLLVGVFVRRTVESWVFQPDVV